jgi:hypothetical protein
MIKRNQTTPPLQPATRDRQILEEIGYLALHRASKKIVTDQKKDLLNQLKKNASGSSKN